MSITRHIPTCTKETYITQKRPVSLKINLYHPKETYIIQKTYASLKRDQCHSAETYIGLNRHLYHMTRSHVDMTQFYVYKRDLYRSNET